MADQPTEFVFHRTQSVRALRSQEWHALWATKWARPLSLTPVVGAIVIGIAPSDSGWAGVGVFLLTLPFLLVGVCVGFGPYLRRFTLGRLPEVTAHFDAGGLLLRTELAENRWSYDVVRSLRFSGGWLVVFLPVGGFAFDARRLDETDRQLLAGWFEQRDSAEIAGEPPTSELLVLARWTPLARDVRAVLHFQTVAHPRQGLSRSLILGSLLLLPLLMSVGATGRVDRDVLVLTLGGAAVFVLWMKVFVAAVITLMHWLRRPGSHELRAGDGQLVITSAGTLTRIPLSSVRRAQRWRRYEALVVSPSAVLVHLSAFVPGGLDRLDELLKLPVTARPARGSG